MGGFRNFSQTFWYRLNPAAIKSTMSIVSKVFFANLQRKYYDHTLKRKDQNKYYCARVVTLIFMLVNICQIFSPVTLLKHMLITNQCAA